MTANLDNIKSGIGKLIIDTGCKNYINKPIELSLSIDEFKLIGGLLNTCGHLEGKYDNLRHSVYGKLIRASRQAISSENDQ